MLIGFDVSHWEGRIDWKTVSAPFGFTKASEGTSFVDSELSNNWKGMKDNKIIRGTYHFLDAKTASAGTQEAKHYLATMKAIGGFKTGDFPPVLDFEAGATSAGAIAFVKELKKHNYKVILYCSESVVPDGLFGADYLWVARYGPSDPGLAHWEFWQSSDGNVGITPHTITGIGNCDIDRFDGTITQLKKLTIKPVKKPKPEPEPMPPTPEPTPEPEPTPKLSLLERLRQAGRLTRYRKRHGGKPTK